MFDRSAYRCQRSWWRTAASIIGAKIPVSTTLRTLARFLLSLSINPITFSPSFARLSWQKGSGIQVSEYCCASNQQSDNMSNPDFEYRPLIGNEIRLVYLEPPAPDSSPSDLLRFRLYHRELDDTAFYNGLSYTWGDPSITECIILNDNVFNITVNLAAALKVLSQRKQLI